jgi:cytoskeletal protein RodZ
MTLTQVTCVRREIAAMEAALMKLLGAIGISGLLLLIGSTAAAYAPQEQSDKPEKQEQKAKPEKQEPQDKPAKQEAKQAKQEPQDSPRSNRTRRVRSSHSLTVESLVAAIMVVFLTTTTAPVLAAGTISMSTKAITIIDASITAGIHSGSLTHGR